MANTYIDTVMPKHIKIWSEKKNWEWLIQCSYAMPDWKLSCCLTWLAESNSSMSMVMSSGSEYPVLLN